MTDKRTPGSDGNADTKWLISRAVESLNAARIGILFAALLVAYPNGDPARAGTPPIELQQLASLSLGPGEALAHTVLPDVAVHAPPTYTEPFTKSGGPRVIGPCSRGADGKIVCPDLMPPLHYDR
jgi:hypothetical protein